MTEGETAAARRPGSGLRPGAEAEGDHAAAAGRGPGAEAEGDHAVVAARGAGTEAVEEPAGPAWVKSDRQLRREAELRGRARRSISIATASTVLVAVLLVILVTSSPGWPRVRETFFDFGQLAESFPDVLRGFLLNVKIFVIAEPIILVLGLVVALVRGLRSPVFFPLRALAVFYTDVFRGIPTILLIYLVGFGIPALQLQGAPNDPVTLGIIALVLSYGAYVAEVFRSGIESVHPSQRSAARSLALSHGQTMRYVVVPQAVRRVVPPLLNDFASLQKDSALVALLGPLEALRQSSIHAASSFNYTPYLCAAALFIALTVPMARFTDHLAARAARRQMGAGHV